MARRAFWRTGIAAGLVIAVLAGVCALTGGVMAQDTPPPRHTPTPTIPVRFTPTPNTSPTSEPPPPARHTPTPTSPVSPPRPTSTPVLVATPPPPVVAPCHALRGRLVNLNGDPVSAQVQLDTVAGTIEQTVDAGGNYAFDCLGEGVALLKPVLPPGLTSLTTDVAVRIGRRAEWRIDLGYYGGAPAPATPLTLTLTSETREIWPGAHVMLTLEVQHRLPQSLAAAWLSLLVPEGLSIGQVRLESGTFEVWQNLLTIELGDLPPDGAATVQLVVLVTPEAAPDARWQLVSFFGYQDGVTRQTAPLDLQITTLAPPSLLPVTGAEPCSLSQPTRNAARR
ncbi:MAG: hypothetical protein ACOYZ7_04425 [Chloroflexota bacterium]